MHLSYTLQVGMRNVLSETQMGLDLIGEGQALAGAELSHARTLFTFFSGRQGSQTPCGVKQC